MARYIKLVAGNGYCGCDLETYEKFDDGTADEAIEDWAYDLTRDNAESYEGVFDFEDDEEVEEYYENIYSSSETSSQSQYIFS